MVDLFPIFPRVQGTAWPITKTPKFGTRIQTSVSGRQLRILDRPLPVWQWTIPIEFLRDKWDVRAVGPIPPFVPTDGRGTAGNWDELRNMMGFFVAVQGQFGGFAYLDLSDCFTTEVIGNTLSNNHIAPMSTPAFPGNTILNFGALPADIQIGDSVVNLSLTGPFQTFVANTYVTGIFPPGQVSIYPPVNLPTGTADDIGFQRPIVFRRTFWTSTEVVGYVTDLIPWIVTVNGVTIPPPFLFVDRSQPLNQRLTFAAEEFPPPNASVVATFGYMYYVRFSEDSLEFENFIWQIWQNKSIKLETILA